MTAYLLLSRCCCVVQDVQVQALQVLSMLSEASPSVPSSRARLWPSIRVALEGLGVPLAAVSRCKQLALQVSM